MLVTLASVEMSKSEHYGIKNIFSFNFYEKDIFLYLT